MNQHANIPNVLYYSKQCPWCAQFMQKATQADILSGFNMIDVYSSTIPIPPQVTSVPSIVIDSMQFYKGSDAFAWLENEVKKTVTNYDIDARGLEFSIIDDSDDHGHKLETFSFIDSQPNSVSASTDDPKDPSLDRLMQQRASEIPGPVQRI